MHHAQRIDQLRKMLAAEPNDAFLQYGLALELHASGDNHAAIEMLEALRSHQPDYTATYYQLAVCYIEADDLQNARNAIESGMQLTKDKHPRTHNELRALLDDIL